MRSWSGNRRMQSLGHNAAKYSKNPKIMQNRKRTGEAGSIKAVPISKPARSLRELLK